MRVFRTRTRWVFSPGMAGSVGSSRRSSRLRWSRPCWRWPRCSCGGTARVPSGASNWPGLATSVCSPVVWFVLGVGYGLTAVAPCGIGQRDLGVLGFTTSVGLRPSRTRLEALTPQVERYLGKVVRGPVWDRLLREYYGERVVIDIAVRRVAVWPDLGASGTMEVTGAAWPGPADPQPAPKYGTGPRVDVAKAACRIATLPHRVLAYRGADGFPVIVPVQIAGHDRAGLRLVVADGLLPPGGRRAGLLTHAYRPQLVGLSTRIFTGWLEVSGDGAVYAPHTSKGFVAPPSKNLLLTLNGLLAKFGLWQARRHGTVERLERLAAGRAA